MSKHQNNRKTAPPKGKGKSIVSGGPTPKVVSANAPVTAPRPAAVAVSVPAVSTTAPQPKTMTVADNARAYRLPLPKSETGLVARARTRGFDVYEYASTVPHPHPMSAGVRALATAHAMARLYELGSRNMVSLYGSDRDLEIAARLNKDVPVGDRFTVTVVGPTVVPQDLARRRMVSTLTKPADGVLLVDIYMMSVQQRFTPADLHELTVLGPVIWVGHDFNGAVGTIEREGCWMRVAPDVIIHYADDDLSYPPHAPADWLFKQAVYEAPGRTGMTAWTTVEAIGDTRVVLARRALVNEVPRFVQPAPAWTTIPLPVLSNEFSEGLFNALPSFVRLRPKLWSWVFRFDTMLVDPHVVAKVTSSLYGKAVDRFSLRQAIQQTRGVLRELMYWDLLERRFPKQSQDFLVGCSLSALISVPAMAAPLHLVSGVYGNSYERHNKMIQHFGSAPEDSSNNLVWYIGAAALVLLGALFTRRPASPSLNWELLRRIEEDTRPRAWLHKTIGWLKATVRDMCGKFFNAQPDIPATALWSSLSDKVKWGLYMAGLGGLEELWHQAIKRLYPAFSWLERIGWAVYELWLNHWFIFMPPGARPAIMAIHCAKHLTMHSLPARWAFTVHVMHNALVAWSIEAPFQALAPFVRTPMGHWTFLGYAGLAASAAFVWWWFSENPPPRDNPWHEYRRRYHDPHTWQPPIDVEPQIQATSFAPSEAAIPRHQHVEDVVPDPLPEGAVGPTLYDEAENMPLYDPAYGGEYYALTPVNAPGAVPALNDASRRYIVTGRLLRRAPITPQLTQEFWGRVLLWTRPYYPLAFRAKIEHDVREPGEVLDSKYLKEWFGLDPRPKTRFGPYQTWDGVFPFISPDPLEIEQRLTMLRTLTTAETHSTPFLREAWLNHFKGDSRRYARAKSALESLDRYPLELDDPALATIKVRPKTDELLLQRGEGPTLVCKPRPIAEVAPRVQARLGPPLTMLGARMKIICPVIDPVPHNMEIVHPELEEPYLRFSTQQFAIEFSLCFGSGSTDLELTLWMSAVIDQHRNNLVDSLMFLPSHDGQLREVNFECRPKVLVWVLVAGDDLLLAISYPNGIAGRNGQVQFMEFDVSKADVSQQICQLRTELAIMQTLGLTFEEAELLDRSHSSAFVIPHRGGALRLEFPYQQRNTGGPNTTTGTSVVVGFAALEALRYALLGQLRSNGERLVPQDFELQMLQAGFTVRSTFQGSPEETFGLEAARRVTFLKGKWWRADWSGGHEDPATPADTLAPAQSLVWAPLPSRVLKLGKTLTDPRQVTGIRDLTLAAPLYLAINATAYQHFALPPVLSEMCEGLRRNFSADFLLPGDAARTWRVVMRQWKYKVQAHMMDLEFAEDRTFRSVWLDRSAKADTPAAEEVDLVSPVTCSLMLPDDDLLHFEKFIEPLVRKWAEYEVIGGFPVRGEAGWRTTIEYRMAYASDLGPYSYISMLPRLDRHCAVEDICYRYGVTSDVVEDTAALMSEAQAFTFLESPLFEAMARVDYG